jgi:cyclic AMP-responsive element-binding protein 3
MATDPDLEWTATILDVKPQVILHDRLMTDAALGTAPIKSEHSYSLTSDGDSIPDSPLSLDNKMDGKDDFAELWVDGAPSQKLPYRDSEVLKCN